MKGTTVVTALMAAAMLLMPLYSLSSAGSTKTSAASASANVIPYANQKTKIKETKNFRILESKTNKVKTISAKDYIIGVVAAEMPADFHEEALKAQAVAAYSFACCRAQAAQKAGEKYDLTDSPDTDQCYIPKESLKEKWGDKTDEYLKKISDAVNAVADYVVTYNGGIATTVYHAISSGKTESSENVWGGKVAYLVPADSVGDKLSDGYLTAPSFSSDDVSAALSKFASATGDPSGWFTERKCTESGRVKSVKFCSAEISGGEIAEALKLRSANFDISYSDGVFTFTVVGYGHGVGMSQVGANYMAMQGSDYKEILLHYYTGCKIQKA